MAEKDTENRARREKEEARKKDDRLEKAMRRVKEGKKEGSREIRQAGRQADKKSR